MSIYNLYDTVPTWSNAEMCIQVEVTDKHVHSPPPKRGYMRYNGYALVFNCIKTGRTLSFTFKELRSCRTLEQFFIEMLLAEGISDKEMLCLNSSSGNGVVQQW